MSEEENFFEFSEFTKEDEPKSGESTSLGRRPTEGIKLPDPPKKEEEFESYIAQRQATEDAFRNTYFVQHQSIVSSAEDYAHRIQQEADEYYQKRKDEADLHFATKKGEIMNIQNKWETDLRAMKQELDFLTEQRDEAYKKIYNEAHNLGYEDGIKKISDQMNERLEHIKNICSGLERYSKYKNEVSEKILMDHTLLIVGKMISKTIPTQPDYLKEIVQKFIDDNPSRLSETQVWIHPSDASFIKQNYPELSVFFNNSDGPSFHESEEIKPGTVICDSNDSYYNSDFVEQLENLKEEIEKAYSERIIYINE